MIKVYRYKADSVCLCAAPSEAVVQSFGGLSEFEALFGGGATLGLPSKLEYVGVWGSRSASHFRRLLREALRSIEIVDQAPPAEMSTAHRTGHRQSIGERTDFEARMPTGRGDTST
jgi:hypothetical protein